MKVGVIGASGKAGSLIVKEAMDRGHDVTAIVRNKYRVSEPVRALEKDLFQLETEDVEEYDVLVNAFGTDLEDASLHVELGRILIDILKGTPETRLIVVGGAGSLYVDRAQTMVLADSPDFPEEFLAIPKNQAQNLEDLQESTGIRWTFLSPAANFEPQGRRTGTYKEGKDNMISNEKGDSYISYADYAVALVDEIENANHVNERFTVVSEE